MRIASAPEPQGTCPRISAVAIAVVAVVGPGQVGREGSVGVVEQGEQVSDGIEPILQRGQCEAVLVEVLVRVACDSEQLRDPPVAKLVRDVLDDRKAVGVAVVGPLALDGDLLQAVRCGAPDLLGGLQAVALGKHRGRVIKHPPAVDGVALDRLGGHSLAPASGRYSCRY